MFLYLNFATKTMKNYCSSDPNKRVSIPLNAPALKVLINIQIVFLKVQLMKMYNFTSV